MQGRARGHRLGWQGAQTPAAVVTSLEADARCPPTLRQVEIPIMSLGARPYSQPRPYRVVVADPHAAAREAIGMVLFADTGFVVVGSAATMEDAIRMIREADPDVLVVDPWLFGEAGLPGCLAAKQLNPHLVIIALLSEHRGDYPRAATAMGADGTVEKHRVGRDLTAAMHAALDRRT